MNTGIMVLRLASVFAATTLLSARAAHGEGDVHTWTEHADGNTHSYQAFFENQLPWADARDFAEMLELDGTGAFGHLATITSQEEQDFIEANVLADLPPCDTWLGGFQPDGMKTPDAGWEWITGEAWIYKNWDAGEPNDAPGGGEDNQENCLNLIPIPGVEFGKWNDLGCHFPVCYIVEWDCGDDECQEDDDDEDDDE